jgi:uncharacterized protein (AIM24 family)
MYIQQPIQNGWYKTKNMQAHEIDYKILGDDIQLVEIELDPQETVVAEAGAMTYMEDEIKIRRWLYTKSGIYG